MILSHVFSLVLSRGLLALLASMLLIACNSAENSSFTDLTGGDLAGSTAEGEVQDVTTPVAPEGIPAVTLSWVAPSEREDGSPLSMAEIAGYRVYYGRSQGNYTHTIDVNNASTMEITLSDLAAGNYYMVVTTVDVDGRESLNSDETTRNL